MAATFDSADSFNAELDGHIQPAQAAQHRLSPTSRAWVRPNNGAGKSADGTRNHGRNNKNVKKNGNKEKEAGVKGKNQRLKIDSSVLPSPETTMSPPVGYFSPPKPREAREGKAKMVFEMQEKEKDKNKKGNKKIGSSEYSNNKPRMSVNMTATEAVGKGNVNFGAGATRNRPTGKMIVDTLKFGFDNMKDAEQDDGDNDSDSESSDLTELSLSPSPGLISSTSSAYGARGTQEGKKATELAAMRLKTKMTNRMNEARLAEKQARQMEAKVGMQKEGRKERAIRRASRRVGGGDGD
jgi:hypothetical protein